MSNKTQAMDVDSGATKAKGKAKKNKGSSAFTHPNFDLHAYISRYTGYTKINRLLYIAERLPSHSKDAFKLALSTIKQVTRNAELYQDTIKRAQENHPSAGFRVDSGWVDTVTHFYQDRIGELEKLVQLNKQNENKDKIRENYNEMASLYVSRGDFQSALAKYVETKDYSMSNKSHLLQMCFNVIQTSVDMGSLSHVKTEAQRAFATKCETTLQKSQLNAALGLYYLRHGNFKMAAGHFGKCQFDIAGNYSSVISSQDIAIYGGLCALASNSRKELKANIIDNSSFKDFMGEVPLVRSIIEDFYGSHYARVFHNLETLKPDLRLDLYMQSHVTKLWKQIRDRALIQFFSPYNSVKMIHMAEAFGVTYDDLEREVANLIIDGKISARIDRHNQVLVATKKEQRSHTWQKVINVGECYARDSKSMLLRMSLIENQLTVRAPRREDDYEDGDLSDGEEWGESKGGFLQQARSNAKRQGGGSKPRNRGHGQRRNRG